jgi:hypothetical protein
MTRRRLRLLWLSVTLLASATSVLEAQRTVALAPGSKVRIRSQGDAKWRVGRLTGIAPDTIRLQSCDSCSVDAYPLTSLSAIQVSMGRIRHGLTIGRGAFYGTFIGLGSGWLYAWQRTRGCKGDLCGLDYLAVPFFGAGGLVIGSAIGSAFRYDDWRPAPIR